MEMSRLTRDGTAEPVSRDQILRHARGQGNIIFPVQLTTSRIGNLTRSIHTLLYVMTIHTYIHLLNCTLPRNPVLSSSVGNLETFSRWDEFESLRKSHELRFFLTQKNKHEALCWRQELEGSTPRSGRWPIY